MADPYIPFGGSATDDLGESIVDSGGTVDSAPDFLGGASDRGEQFDPTIHAGPDKRNADGRYTRKRGRRGNNSSSPRNSKAQNTSGIEALTRALAIVHLGLAAATKTPELALDDKEAETLAAATAHVLQEFDIRPDPKVEACFALVVACGTVYGPKVYFIRERWKEEAKAKAAEDASA